MLAIPDEEPETGFCADGGDDSILDRMLESDDGIPMGGSKWGEPNYVTYGSAQPQMALKYSQPKKQQTLTHKEQEQITVNRSHNVGPGACHHTNIYINIDMNRETGDSSVVQVCADCHTPISKGIITKYQQLINQHTGNEMTLEIHETQ